MEVEELTVAFSDEDTGEEVIKELDKEITRKKTPRRATWVNPRCRCAATAR